MAKTRTGKRKRGRPSKFGPEVDAKIFSCIQAGNYIETAAQFAGVAVSGVRARLARGRDIREAIERGEKVSRRDHEVFVDFLEAVEVAQAHSEVSAVVALRQAFASNPRLIPWFLQHAFPSRWAKPSRVEVSGPDGEPIATKDATPPVELTDDERLRRIKAVVELVRRGEMERPAVFDELGITTDKGK